MTPQGESKRVIIANVAEAYTSGDLIGQPMAVDVANNKGSAQSVMLQNINIADSSKVNKKLKLVIYAEEPTTVLANNAAFAPGNDAKKIVDVINIDAWTAAYTAVNIAIAKQLALAVCTNTSRKYWVALLAGEDLTFTAANAVTITMHYYID